MVGGGNKNIDPCFRNVTKPYDLWLWCTPEEREELFSPGENRKYRRKAERQGKRIHRTWMWLHIKTRVRSFFISPFNWFRKPRPVVWLDDYGGVYPACPRCQEPAYEKDRCCFCGQKYTWEATKT